MHRVLAKAWDLLRKNGAQSTSPYLPSNPGSYDLIGKTAVSPILTKDGFAEIRYSLDLGGHAHPRSKTAALPDLDENLLTRWDKLPPARRLIDTLKEVWNSDTMLRQLYGSDWIEFDPEQAAWDDAVDWILAKHNPQPKVEPMVRFDWKWPDRSLPSEQRRWAFEDDDEEW